jgi:hypothetical protein
MFVMVDIVHGVKRITGVLFIGIGCVKVALAIGPKLGEVAGGYHRGGISLRTRPLAVALRIRRLANDSRRQDIQ